MDVSAVIPLFNKAPYIARAIESVLRQTTSVREIIVVDDGSTDGAGEVVRAMHDSRLRLISQANAGVSAARNAGILASTTGWIGLLDADDEWKPQFLERVSDRLQKQPDVVCVGTDFLDGAGSRMVGLSDQDADFFTQSLGRGIPVVCSSAVVVSREAIIKCGLFPEGCHAMEDIDTWMRLAWTGTIAFIPEPLAIYHTEIANSTSKRNRANGLLIPRFLETYVEWSEAGRIPDAQRDASAAFARDWLFRFVRHLIFQGRQHEARATLTRFETLAAGDDAARRKLVARSRVPNAVPAASRFLKSMIGAYRKPEFL